MKKLLLLSIPFFLSLKAFALEVDCKYTKYFKNITTEELHSCDLIDAYGLRLNALAKFNKIQPLIHLNISKEGMGASFSNSGFIYISNKLYALKDDSKTKVYRNREANITTFIHEYGHAVLHSLLLDNYEFYSRYRDAQLDLEKVNSKLNEVVELSKELREITVKNGYTLEEVNEAKLKLSPLMGQYFSLGFQIDQLTSQLKSHPIYKKIEQRIHPIHEFYADVITSLVNSDPETMYNAIIYNGMNSKKRESYKYRSFLNDSKLEEWDNNQKHALFAPSRSYLGKVISFSTLTINEKRIILNALNKAVISYIDQTWEIEDLSSKEMNSIMIESIKAFNP